MHKFERLKVDESWLRERLPHEAPAARLGRVTLPPWLKLTAKGQQIEATTLDRLKAGELVTVNVTALAQPMLEARTRVELLNAARAFLFKVQVHEVYEWLALDGRQIFDAHAYPQMWDVFRLAGACSKVAGEWSHKVAVVAPTAAQTEPSEPILLPARAGGRPRAGSHLDAFWELFESVRLGLR